MCDLRSLCIFLVAGIGFGVMALAEAEEVEPQAHEVERYELLWADDWFRPPKTKGASVAATERPFPYKLVGLASLEGRKLVYLTDKAGRIVELTYGRPYQDLSLVQVIEGGRENGETTVYVRQNARVVPLKYSRTAVFSSDAPPPIPTQSLAAQIYLRKTTFNRSVKRTYGVARHRVPGTTPVPPPRPKRKAENEVQP